MSSQWDFIIVGSGPAGCAVAAGLAHTSKKPKVLLLEAGGRNQEDSLRVDGQRWTTFHNPELNWGYKTVPQQHCNNRELEYHRGRMLGGSSAINFSAYTRGPREDYDRWAEKVGDETFRWEQMLQRFKRLESFHGEFQHEEYYKYASPSPSDHGSHGPLHVGYAREWENDLPLIMDGLIAAGLERNLDLNSGNPLGIGLASNTAYQGRRSTAADLLLDAPDNLTVLAQAAVQRVILEGKKVIGVESGEHRYYAAKEVVLCAGTLDNPRILMHSGIGPRDELARFRIPVRHDLPAVGKGLRDHPAFAITLERKAGTNDRNAFFKNPDAMAEAQEQWDMDRTGPWARHSCQLVMGFLKMDDRLLGSSEFASLPADVQEFLQRPTVPHWELIANAPLPQFAPGLITDFGSVTLLAIFMNEQSVGEVRLQSSDPNVPLLFDPHFLEHPYDRKGCVDMVRELLALVRHEAIAKDTLSTLVGPASDSEADILEFCRATATSVWHMTGTVVMGAAGDPKAGVDSHFRVLGLEALRVADMSVVPILPNNHTQSTAYVTGMTCADVMIEEYGLDV
ncbi:hypothetical protein ASPZODRAFT_11580 [Penicilliopsis zonata CBS 506.65]|uniref:Glucose-methanol-choline oxidoreductase N-terminal domain-containing protein n=1 Tax=Penicilliopsis zonata CBS 506.65 TaxID=1073090 RepID=A0A1L9SU27_9EURO|nr:hypothetical protein ASPZODRAFT_11580 [Penicilliopsis zonata CBS 506.65]OJJ50725.1 hypothetical protein ASPZODRAFT_11580 [Penicilliopsis zonata CBS 506.65]